MKTKITITLSDDERSRLANMIDQKSNKRLISRSEVVDLCQRHIGGLIGGQYRDERIDRLQPKADITKPDPEDIAVMAQPNNPEYCRGWNKVKNGI